MPLFHLPGVTLRYRHPPRLSRSGSPTVSPSWGKFEGGDLTECAPSFKMARGINRHVRPAVRTPREDDEVPPGRGQGHGQEHGRGLEDDAPGLPRGRRQLQGGQGLRSPDQGQGPGRGGPRRPESRPAGHQDRPRRAGRDPRGGPEAPPVRRPPALDLHARRPSGERQDHDLRQAGPLGLRRSARTPCSSPSTSSGRPPRTSSGRSPPPSALPSTR